MNPVAVLAIRNRVNMLPVLRRFMLSEIKKYVNLSILWSVLASLCRFLVRSASFKEFVGVLGTCVVFLSVHIYFLVS